MKVIIKRAFKVTCCALPIIVIACFIGAIYSVQIMLPGLRQNAGVSESVLIIISGVQSSVMVVICCFFGYILADITGLLRKMKFERGKLIKMFIYSVVAVIILVSDYFVFAKFMPQVMATYTHEYHNLFGLGAGVLYGGIVEELLLRLFGISLSVFIIWKVFKKNIEARDIPRWIFIASNVIIGLVFAALHIPATIGVFGMLTPMILLRCFLLNGFASLLFGDLYIKDGLHYAMGAHGIANLLSTLIIMILI